MLGIHEAIGDVFDDDLEVQPSPAVCSAFVEMKSDRQASSNPDQSRLLPSTGHTGERALVHQQPALL